MFYKKRIEIQECKECEVTTTRKLPWYYFFSDKHRFIICNKCRPLYKRYTVEAIQCPFAHRTPDQRLKYVLCKTKEDALRRGQRMFGRAYEYITVHEGIL